MRGLRNLHRVVTEVLWANEEARRDDMRLILEVLGRMGIDTDESFARLAESGQLRRLETITRVRRRVQAEHPELRDEKVMEQRAQKEDVYREYAKERTVI